MGDFDPQQLPHIEPQAEIASLNRGSTLLEHLSTIGNKAVMAVQDAYRYNRLRMATYVSLGLGAAALGGAGLPRSAAANTRAALPYPRGGCVETGLDASGGAYYAFQPDNPHMLQLTTMFGAIQFANCSNYSREIDVYESVENNSRTGFYRNTPISVFKGVGNINTVTAVGELTDSTTCLPDGQARLRAINYEYKMIGKNGHRSFYSTETDAILEGVTQPGNTCQTNTRDLTMQTIFNDKQSRKGILAKSKHASATIDLPLIHNRKPSVHHAGLTVELRGAKTASPRKSTEFEVVDKSKKTEKGLSIIVISGRQQELWKDNLKPTIVKRHFFTLRFPQLSSRQHSAAEAVLVEATKNGRPLFRETEIIREVN